MKKPGFKQIWRKAIEKYSPKKATKLNEISNRFNEKMKVIKQKNKNSYDEDEEEETNGVSGLTKNLPQKLMHEEPDKIKFVSMID